MWWADIEVPNRAVDVNSWARSACYPQGSFCPLSDGPPTRDHRITKSCFRTCSDRRPRSQTLFYLCARWVISIHSERIFERLRYSLGGDRPSQTARLPMSSTWIHRYKLESQSPKAGISLLPPHPPQGMYQRLPAMLRIKNRNSMTSYSKAP